MIDYDNIPIAIYPNISSYQDNFINLIIDI